MGAENSFRWADDKVHQVDQMRGVIVKASAAFGLFRAPRTAALWPNHYLPECAAADVIDFAECAGAYQTPSLAECSDEPVVVPNLVGATLGFGEIGERLALPGI